MLRLSRTNSNGNLSFDFLLCTSHCAMERLCLLLDLGKKIDSLTLQRAVFCVWGGSIELFQWCVFYFFFMNSRKRRIRDAFYFWAVINGDWTCNHDWNVGTVGGCNHTKIHLRSCSDATGRKVLSGCSGTCCTEHMYTKAQRLSACICMMLEDGLCNQMYCRKETTLLVWNLTMLEQNYENPFPDI